ncbi:MAG: cell wall hydrolase [Oscillospiraceae bacterium]|nr:cell wall hydrolase [Oscillospiraceae bacterium]
MSKIKERIIIIILIIFVISASVYTHIHLNYNPVKDNICLAKIDCPDVKLEWELDTDGVDDTTEEVKNEAKKQENNTNASEVVSNEETTTEEVIVEVNTNYTEDDLYWLSKAIAQELGSYWVPDWAQQWVASVVLNRVNHPSFPNTIYDVLHQPGQYCGFYATPTEQNITNARYVLENGSVLPENVVFQSLFTQGSGIHGTYYDPYMNNTTYFCYK